MSRQALTPAMFSAMILAVGFFAPPVRAANLNVEKTVAPRIESYLSNALENQKFTGVALVARGGEVIHANGYGNAKEGLSNNIDTAFHVASVSKQFTAAAVMQLVDVFRARVVDVAPDSVIIETTGTEEKINGLLEVLRPYGIRELVRTGRVGMVRGSESVMVPPPSVPRASRPIAEDDESVSYSV